jgi:5-methylcytosine-specific restriction protein A
VAAGRLVDGDIYEGEHWADPARVAHYVDIEWDDVVSIGDRLPLDELVAAVPGHHWNVVLASGQQVAPPNDVRLEALWTAHVRSVRSGTATWTLAVGDTLSRDARRAQFGGAVYGGIEPSKTSPNVFLYSDPRRGTAYGYNYDGWSADGEVFLYTGEGRLGPQKMSHGNAAILNHRAQSRALRLFVADGTEIASSAAVQRYIGEFEVTGPDQVRIADAPDQLGDPRTVFVFRLKPIGPVLRRPEDLSASGDAPAESEAALLPIDATAASAASADAVPLEALNKARYAVAGSSGTIAARLEAELVGRFTVHLSGLGAQCGRYKLRPPGEFHDLYTDLFDETANVLYEAKGVATRDAVRMALGQLLDYSRHIPTQPKLAVLLPRKPSPDLLELLRLHAIGCVYEEAPGVFALVQDFK